ncbi:MAG: hypothetical protein K2M31_03445 [Muribaculaceae bacterium]|nr:hypothetical protein [Muribaculaceae bacterium]
MARKPSRNSSSSRQRGRSRKGGGSSPTLKIIMIILGVAVVAGLGWAIYKFAFNTGYQFKRADLDQYVKMSGKEEVLGDGASVYVDMSDGMNSAYASQEAKSVLQSIINKLAANNAIQFYGLADMEISPLEMSHTELYNHILNPASYDKQKAPIEKTLEKIVSENKPAVLLSDFEEYKGSVIEHAAYAKKYFIEWLEKGYKITFYKWPFVENGKQKLMFVAVFDDNANRLDGLVANAVALSSPNLPRYVLGGHDFNFPMQASYLNIKEGGNYHNSKGEDAVTAVISNGGPEDYYRYSQPLATADGQGGAFLPLDSHYGEYAEYYPLGVTWTDAIKNSKAYQEEGVPEEDRFTHLFSKLYVDFGAQNGYTIDEVEVRTFDMMETMKAVADSTFNDVKAPEVNIFLKASMEPAQGMSGDWKELFIDFDSQFNGSFINGVDPTTLIRANIVIGKVSANIAEAIDFFSWEGNPSLADSVKETLTAGSSSPEGRILYTYYLKTFAE